jgi:hypothetical protein
LTAVAANAVPPGAGLGRKYRLGCLDRRFVMNSIVLTRVFAPDGEMSLDSALNRLGAYRDAELGCLEDLLDIAGHGDAIDDIGSFHRR